MESVSPNPPVRRVQRVRHELKRRPAQVRRVESLGPGFAAVTSGGEAFADFVSLSFDDHIKFLIADKSGSTVGRDFTPRRHDAAACEVTIEFALHSDGPASRWARAATVGQVVEIGGPRGSMIVPTDFDWHLLAGDASALPAIHRRLEELPPDARIVVVLDVPREDRRQLARGNQVEIRWVTGADEMLSTVQNIALPEGEGFAWAAGEASTMARLRHVLADEKRLPKEAMRVAAYWKRGESAHHQNLAE